MQYRPSYAEIHLDHLQENFLLLKNSLTQNEFLCPMVKADAYGHGAIVIAQTLFRSGAKQVGVCLIEEALDLRQAGIQEDILVFRGFDLDGAREIQNMKLIAVCSEWSHLHLLKQSSNGGKIRIHLKFDTGMNRLGFSIAEVERLSNYFNQHPEFQIEGLCTHLLRGEDIDEDSGSTRKQLAQMLDVESVLKKFTNNVHCYNSAGFMGRLSMQKKQQQLPEILAKPWGVRPGIMLYGSQPSNKSKQFQLRPVMSLRSQIQLIRRVAAGEGVSYNSTFVALTDSEIAVVPIGYADGYHRLLSNRGHVLVHGEFAPVVGNVCMDYLMIDVTNLKKRDLLSSSSVVTFFGCDEEGRILDINEVAHQAQTISYELMTSVSRRIPRRMKGLPE